MALKFCKVGPACDVCEFMTCLSWLAASNILIFKNSKIDNYIIYIYIVNL